MPGQRARAGRALPSLALLSLLLVAILVAAGPTWGAPAAQQAQRHREQPFPPPTVSPPAPLAATGTLRTFSPVADTEVQSGNPATNFGIEPFLGAGFEVLDRTPQGLGPAGERRALLSFDITPFLPPGTVIHSATMRLYQGGYCGRSTDGPFQAFRIAADWSELRATWNNQPATAEGFERLSSQLGTGWANFDLTSLVQAWVSGASPEHGVMLRGPAASPDCASRDFRSKGGGGLTTRPALLVDYTLPAPALSASASAVTFTRVCGQPPPAAQAITLASSSTAISSWSVTQSGGDGWLTLSKSAGQITHIFPDRVRLSVGEGAACPGTSTATLQLSAPGLATPAALTVVYQQVTEAPPPKTPRAYLPAISRSGGAAPAALAAASPSRTHVLLVGVADYKYLDPPTTFSLLRPGGWGKDLMVSDKDPHIIEDIFKAVSADVTNLTDEQVTLPYIQVAFSRYEDRLRDALQPPCGGAAGASVADGACSLPNFVVMLSGHGGQVADAPPLDEGSGQAEEFYGLYDTNLTPELVNGLRDDDLSAMLARLAPAHVTVIIDACNSGGMEVGSSLRAVLAAAREDQESWETSELEHGVFSYYLVQSSSNPACDTNGNGWLSARELFGCAAPQASAYVLSRQQKSQNPVSDITQDIDLVPLPPQVAGP